MKLSSHDTPEARDWRKLMVREQLAARGIRDRRVLAAMLAVPRHLFCPPETALADAYGDSPLPIGAGQTISQPWMVADMLERLGLTGREDVLEIGAGSGYNAALLGRLARTVHSVELLPELAEAAGRRLAALGVANAHVHAGDGARGWPAAAPYDRIIITAAAPAVPEPLAAQLAENGLLLAPLGDRFLQQLQLFRQSAGGLVLCETSTPCRFVPLRGPLGFG
ncbi:MAG: protein-L-isoaspartate(D-aspartate) O-methyltransferase [Lentisphaeria bacterium]